MRPRLFAPGNQVRSWLRKREPESRRQLAADGGGTPARCQNVVDAGVCRMGDRRLRPGTRCVEQGRCRRNCLGWNRPLPGRYLRCGADDAVSRDEPGTCGGICRSDLALAADAMGQLQRPHPRLRLGGCRVYTLIPASIIWLAAYVGWSLSGRERNSP